MSTPLRVAVFVVGLAVLFVASVGAGRVVGDGDDVTPAPAAHGGHGDMRHETTGTSASEELPGGLMTTEHGYTFRLLTPLLEPGTRTVSFVIDGPDGQPVRDFDLEHEKELHLVAVRRDFTGFQHVHPARADDGTWSVPLDLLPGTWRLFADFNPTGGTGLTLGQDLTVPGDFRPTADTGVRRSVVVDGYEVSVRGDLVAGQHSMLTLHVTRGGEPVTDLQAYLGAYGHLVALREGDLAYLHVHPSEGKPGPDIEFGAEVPSAGTYHLYLDFRHGGVVRTAPLELQATR